MTHHHSPLRARASGTLIAALLLYSTALGGSGSAAEQPIAILHAHDEPFKQVADYVCDLGKQGYTHVQIAPPQKSSDASNAWYMRYQPVDYLVIEGRGSAADLKALTSRAHACGMKVIADVVLNHMSSNPKYKNLTYPTFTAKDFHRQCQISYSDGNPSSERNCWLNGDLPDLDQSKPNVAKVQKEHLKLLVDLGVDGFRFDAAKHMDPSVLADYISYASRITANKAWNYLEVIDDQDTSVYIYTPIAAVTDFVLCDAMKNAFSYGGSLSSLRLPKSVNDSRSVTFGVNHDSDPQINPGFPKCQYTDRSDAVLADAYVLAREGGTPLILAKDNLAVPYLPAGVKFRRIISSRAREAKNVKENVLAVLDPQNVLFMERGSEGFFVVNKGAGALEVPVLDLTLTNLDGCYRELRNNFTVAIERRPYGKKYVTRWGSWSRGGLQILGRDALYFVREPFSLCAPRT
jgi:alpha-amylase